MRDSHILTNRRKRDGARPPRPKRRNLIGLRFKIISALLGLTVALTTFFYLYTISGKVKRMLLRGEIITTLLLGTDEVGNSFRADTILLAIYSPSEKRLNLISIPRDTMVVGPDGKADKLNHLFAYDHRRLGPEGASLNLVRIIKRNLGLDIHFYAQTDYLGFTRLVDAVGGVRVDIARDMRYVDRAGGLSIDLEKGPQTLDGNGALQYVRYRSKVSGDLGRMERQARLLQSLARRLEQPSTITILPRLSALTLRNIHSNLNLMDVMALFREFKGPHGVNIQSSILPGTPVWVEGVSYWRTDGTRSKALLETVLSPRSERSGARTVKIEVLNGVGVDRIAERMAQMIRRRPELDVVEVGNANHFDYLRTTVVSRRGNAASARMVASLIGLREEDVLSDFDGGSLADVSVIVGRDYKKWIER